MVEILKFKREHYMFGFEPQEHNMGFAKRVNDSVFEMMEASPFAHTIRVGGRTVALVGMTFFHPDRAETWGVLSKDCTEEFLAIHKVVRKYLSGWAGTRLESVVEVGFEPGHRWAQALGFKYEGLMRGYLPGGKDAIMYVRF